MPLTNFKFENTQQHKASSLWNNTSWKKTARKSSTAFIMSLAITLSSCATRPSASDPIALQAYEDANDPLEPFNRAVFAFNNGFDKIALAPAARIYRTLGPAIVRDGISNFVYNWKEPVTFINDILQAEPKRAGISLGRFLINSTFGLLGFLDTASYWGIEGHKEDFGQTFAVWGIGEGFYLMLPFLGPSSARDFSGFMLDFFYDPVSMTLTNHGLTYIRYGRLAMRGLIYREKNLETLDDLSRSSADFYATIRSAYRQNRQYKISNGVINIDDEDDMFDEEFEEEF
jgi:phospholipid-binding lipoprotein MlaA